MVFYLADIHRLINALRLADYRFVALSYAISLLWLVVRGFAWRTLLKNKATLSQAFFTVNEGYLLNNLLPFRLGEVGRAFLMSRKAGLDFMGVLSTILIERALDLLIAAGLLLSTLPFVIGASWAREAAILAGGIVLAGLVCLYLLARYSDWTSRQFESLLSRWQFLAKLNGQEGRISRQVKAFLSGLAVLTDGGLFLRAVAWILLDWGISVFQYATFLLAFFPSIKLLWAPFCLAFVALGVAAPSSPGAVGVMELSTVAALALFGLDSTLALAMALTAHLSNYLITGILGAYALARDGETLSGLYQRVRRLPQK